MIFDYMSSSDILTISREYRGVIETLSDIGGIKEILHMIFMFIYPLYHAVASRSIMVKKIFETVRASESSNDHT